MKVCSTALVFCLFAATAQAQPLPQPSPDAPTMQLLIGALEAQRNEANNREAMAAMRAMKAEAENQKLKEEIEKLKKQLAEHAQP